MRRKVTIAVAVTAMAVSGAMGTTAANAVIKIRPVATGLNGPSGFTFAPNGTIWFLERGTGEVRTLDPVSGNRHLVFTIAGVDGSGERGALGIALHPRWPHRKVVYAYVTRMSDGRLRNQLVRISIHDGTGSNLRVLLQSPASSSPYHNGGRILFGPGNKLYVMIGDGHNAANAQDRTDNLRGKVLRLDPDGTAAKGNPYGKIWSYGHRNSFGSAFDPRTGRLWETENGPQCTDEINLIVKGANFGWGPRQSCSLPKPRGTNNSGPRPRHQPKRYYASTIGITGAAFCQRCGIGRLNGDLVFGDVNTGAIRTISLNAKRTDFSNSGRIIKTAPSGVHSVELSPRRHLFFSTANGIYRLVAV